MRKIYLQVRLILKKRIDQSRNITSAQTHFIDKLDFKNKSIEKQENWLDYETDGELETADIDESDFHFYRNNFE